MEPARKEHMADLTRVITIVTAIHKLFVRFDRAHETNSLSRSIVSRWGLRRSTANATVFLERNYAWNENRVFLEALIVEPNVQTKIKQEIADEIAALLTGFDFERSGERAMVYSGGYVITLDTCSQGRDTIYGVMVQKLVRGR
jgi:hypothetical protein